MLYRTSLIALQFQIARDPIYGLAVARGKTSRTLLVDRAPADIARAAVDIGVGKCGAAGPL